MFTNTKNQSLAEVYINGLSQWIKELKSDKKSMELLKNNKE